MSVGLSGEHLDFKRYDFVLHPIAPHLKKIASLCVTHCDTNKIHNINFNIICS